MDRVRMFFMLVGTVVIAAWVAYSVSAPRNLENSLDEPMEQLDGSSIGETLAEGQAEARRRHCEAYTEQARIAWDRAVENNRLAEDQERLDELDRKVKEFCG